MLLTVETAASYVKENLSGVFAETSSLSAKEIAGGNLNYAFVVKDDNDVSVFVKQAPDFIKVFGPEAKLHKERLELEVKAYKEYESLLGLDLYERHFPKIYFEDYDNMICIMEFLQEYVLLDESLFAGVASLKVAADLGNFMGTVHGRSHCTRLDADRVKDLTTTFENKKLRDIQLEYVFTKAFRESERAEKLRTDPEFMEQLGKLKAAYCGENTDSLALSHGDLHAGSIMVNADKDISKIIDPEFVIYGPPGLDIGSLVSSYSLAVTKHAFSGNKEAASNLHSCVQTIWDSYAAAVRDCGISSEIVTSIEQDAVGFAGCEVARTALGFAGVRGLPIADDDVKRKAEDVAVDFAYACVVGEKGQGMKLLCTELQKLIELAASA